MNNCSVRYPVCSQCGDVKHFVTECVKAIKCINCGSDHAANDKNCSK